MEAVKIPRHADDPPHLLLWSMDEVVPIVAGITFGILVGKMLICMGIGVIFSQVYKRFRDNHTDGYLVHALYWLGVPVSPSKHFPNPFIRRFLP
jgi:conjugal transfer pilus assembly protein TraL